LKTLRISDDAHLKLTSLLGELTAQTMRMQTYTDAIENLLSQSVTLPPELLVEIEKFIDANRSQGYTTREEFIRDAVRRRLQYLKDEYACIEVSKEDFDRAQSAVKDMGLPFLDVSAFVRGELKGLVEKYGEFCVERDSFERKRRKRG